MSVMPGFHMDYDGVYNILVGLMSFLLVFFLIIAAIGIVSYILGSIGLFTMAKRRGIKNYGLAWVPMIDGWILGSLADQYDRKEKGKDIPTRKFILIFGIIYLVMDIILMILSVVMLVNSIELMQYGNMDMYAEQMLTMFVSIYVPSILMSMVAIAYSVFYYIALYKVYKSCSPSSRVILLVFSIIFGIAPFVIFALRNKDEGYVILNSAQGNGSGQPQPEA